MIRQSADNHTTSARHDSHRTVGFQLGPSTGCDTTAVRQRRIRQHDDFDLPLYRASLADDVATIRKLCPQASARRIMVMVATARAFARIETGWDSDAFYTVTFDQTLGVWRRSLLFSGPVPVPSCAVCGRPAVYRLRDTPFCRMHGPDHLDRRTDSLFSNPIVSDHCHSMLAAARDLSINH